MIDNQKHTNLIEQPNFTKIPNVVLDYWLTHLEPYTSIVLIFLCRKTFGYQGKNGKDNISLSQISKGTNMSRPSVIKSLSILENLLLIKKCFNKSKCGDKDSNTYEIFIHDPKQIKENYVVNDVDHVVNDVDYGGKRRLPQVVNDVYIQKKTIQKKIDKRKQQQLEEGEDVDNFHFDSSSEKVDSEKKESFKQSCRSSADSMFNLLRNKSEKFGEDWLISSDVLCCLCMKECPAYVLDQVNYMILKHQKALEMMRSSYKIKDAKPVKSPIGYLKYACTTNQAESIHKKDI